MGKLFNKSQKVVGLGNRAPTRSKRLPDDHPYTLARRRQSELQDEEFRNGLRRNKEPILKPAVADSMLRETQGIKTSLHYAADALRVGMNSDGFRNRVAKSNAATELIQEEFPELTFYEVKKIVRAHILSESNTLPRLLSIEYVRRADFYVADCLKRGRKVFAKSTRIKVEIGADVIFMREARRKAGVPKEPPNISRTQACELIRPERYGLRDPILDARGGKQP